MNNTITITLNDEQMSKLRALAHTRENQTLDEIANTVIERGLYDLAYRTKRNREQWAQFKEFKKSLR
jgi:hypothetical protein